MLAFYLRAYLVSITVTASQSPRVSRRDIVPRNYRISSKDTEINVQDSSALDKDRVPFGIAGTYTKLSSVGTNGEALFLQYMQEKIGHMTLIGQWRRDQTAGAARYLLVFNQQSFRGSLLLATEPQRWIIASFRASTLPHGLKVDPNIKFDTEEPRKGDSRITLHASISTSESVPAPDQPGARQTQDDEWSVPRLSQKLREVQDQLKAQTAKVDEMNGRRVQLEHSVAEKQALVDQTRAELSSANTEILHLRDRLVAQDELSENAQSANSKIEKLQNQIAAHCESKSSLEHEMAQLKEVMSDQRNKIDELRTAQVLANEHVHEDALQSIIDSKQSEIDEKTAEIKALQQSLVVVSGERDQLIADGTQTRSLEKVQSTIASRSSTKVHLDCA